MSHSPQPWSWDGVSGLTHLLVAGEVIGCINELFFQVADGHLESSPAVECGVQLPEGLTFEWTVALTQCVMDEEPGRVQTEHTDLSVHARMSVFCFVAVCVGIIPKASCLPDRLHS